MAEGGERLRSVLGKYAKSLRERELALPKHQPYLVRWVREFLLFARQHGGYNHLAVFIPVLEAPLKLALCRSGPSTGSTFGFPCHQYSTKSVTPVFSNSSSVKISQILPRSMRTKTGCLRWSSVLMYLMPLRPVVCFEQTRQM